MLRCLTVPNTSPATLVNERGIDEASSLTLQERKQQLVRTAIWDAATDLFAEKGYDETTIDDIAKRAGVSRRSFFRYFTSKSDLMAYGAIGYAGYLTEAIRACPAGCPLSEVFRRTVFQVAEQCAAHPRTRKIMEIAAKYPAAKEAQQSRTAELQERVEAAFARHVAGQNGEDLTPHVVTGLTLSVLAVIFRAWFEHGQQDISVTANQVLATLDRLVCHDKSQGRRTDD
ncbi:MAG TPA: TetR/AcrR family transcriptional regulator [Bryobacteraceae bacterium]|nr:TetR/AcrR family transcriptional regulator [Bryobacteraceae bacterium]